MKGNIKVILFLYLGSPSNIYTLIYEECDNFLSLNIGDNKRLDTISEGLSYEDFRNE